ncbi:arylamine N-acetyltransferase, partial [Paenibacillus sepulcri]|nr:arylamine N-acetyltransferase [Paenibacillus sepulcri]
EGISYLCDVGVGGIVPRRPIQMQELLEQPQGEESYLLEQDAYYGWVLCEWKRGGWSWLYSFTDEPQLPKDFIMATYWCENAPDSIFTRNAMVAMRTREGRNTIAGQEFRIFTADGVHAFTPASEDDYNEALLTYFGIAAP